MVLQLGKWYCSVAILADAPETTMSFEPTERAARSEARPLRRVGLRWNAASNAIGNISFFAVVFLTTPIAIRRLGDVHWGIWQLVGAATQYGVLLTLGLGTAIHYQVSYLTARRDYTRLATAFSNVRIYFAFVAVLMIGVLLLAGLPLLRTLVDPDEVPAAWDALLVTMVLTAASLPIRFYGPVLGGLQRFDLYGAFQTAAAALLFVCVIGGFSLGMGLTGFALVMGLGAVGPFVASWLAARRLLPSLAFRWTSVDLALLGSMVRYSLSTTIFLTGSALLYQSMKFLASWLCGGAEAAGRIGLAISIVQTVAVAFTPIFGVVLSRVGQLHGEGRLHEIKPLLDRVSVLNGLAVIPTVIFLGAAARPLFEAWVGNAVAAAAIAQLARTTQIMLVGQAAYILTLPSYHALLGIGEHWVFGVGMLGAGSASVALGWAVARLHPEIESLAGAFAAAMVGLFVCVTLPVLVRRFSIDIGRFLWRGLAFPALVSIPGVVAIAFRPRLGSSLLELVVAALLFGLSLLPSLLVVRRWLSEPRVEVET